MVITKDTPIFEKSITFNDRGDNLSILLYQLKKNSGISNHSAISLNKQDIKQLKDFLNKHYD